MSVIDLVNAISSDVVSKLSAGGLPPLVDGGIVVGRVKQDETSAPPRVVFIPRSFRFEPRSTPAYSQPLNARNPLAPGSGVRSFAMTAEGSGYSNSPTVTLSAPDAVGGVQATATAVVTSNGAISKIVPSNAGSGYLNPPTVTINDSTGTGAGATAYLGPSPQALAVIQQRAILTEVVQFEVHVWGVASVNGVVTPSPNGDFAATQQLYQQVIASTHLLAAGVYKPLAGKWTDAAPNTAALDLLGHEVVFGLEIAAPVLDSPIVPTAGANLQLAPVNTQGLATLSIAPFAGGSPEQGSSG